MLQYVQMFQYATSRVIDILTKKEMLMIEVNKENWLC